MTRPNDIYQVKIILSREVVEMGIDECQSRASTPMSQQFLPSISFQVDNPILSSLPRLDILEL
jgi:hypothetical protein